MGSNIFIRQMQKNDLDAMVQIDSDILGIVRRDYYKNKIEKCLERENRLCSLVATEDEKVVGFLIGEICLGEYGFRESSAIVDTIGIYPRYQGFGIAAKLYKEFLGNVRKLGIRKIYTIVHWEDLDLIKFFNGEGFTPSKRLCLEMEI